MQVQVTKFMVQHNGETFHAGDVFKIDDEQGRALIARTVRLVSPEM